MGNYAQIYKINKRVALKPRYPKLIIKPFKALTNQLQEIISIVLFETTPENERKKIKQWQKFANSKTFSSNK